MIFLRLLIRPLAVVLFWLAFLLMAALNGALLVTALAAGFLGRCAGYDCAEPKIGKREG